MRSPLINNITHSFHGLASTSLNPFDIYRGTRELRRGLRVPSAKARFVSYNSSIYVETGAWASTFSMLNLTFGGRQVR